MSLIDAVSGMLERIGRLERTIERQGSGETPGLKLTGAGISATSTTATSAVDMTGATITRTTYGRPVLVLAAFVAVTSTPAGFCNFQLHLDGVNQANFVFDDLTTARSTLEWVQPFPSVAAGSHTWKVQWYGTGGATVAHSGGHLYIIEL
jgi:hypothetical protein